jgi:hypothetical protein
VHVLRGGFAHALCCGAVSGGAKVTVYAVSWPL